MHIGMITILMLVLQALSCENWEDGQPLSVEEDFWDDALLQVCVDRSTSPGVDNSVRLW